MTNGPTRTRKVIAARTQKRTRKSAPEMITFELKDANNSDSDMQAMLQQNPWRDFQQSSKDLKPITLLTMKRNATAEQSLNPMNIKSKKDDFAQEKEGYNH